MREGTTHGAPPLWVRGASHRPLLRGPVDPPRGGGLTHQRDERVRGPAASGAAGPPRLERLRQQKEQQPINLYASLVRWNQVKKLKYAWKYTFAYLHKHKLNTNSQFRILKQVSTSDTPIPFTEFLHKILDFGEHIPCIFVDLGNTFVTVNHNILLDKLERSGVRGIALAVFKSCLSHRKHYVSLNRVKSTLGDIKILCSLGQ